MKLDSIGINSNILYIVPADYDDLLEKGVGSMILDRDEGGYFSTVTTLHPFARSNQQIKLSKNNEIIQYGWKFSFTKINKFKLIKFIGTIRLLFKLLILFPFQIKNRSINIIRATDPYYTSILALYYSRLFNTPCVVSVHSDYDETYEKDNKKGSFTVFGSRYFAKKMEKYVFKKCDSILPISNYLANKYQMQYNLPKEKFYIFPHGIDLEKFDNTEYIDIRQKFNLSLDLKILSFVGRLSKENYIYDVISIAKLLAKKNKDFIMLIAGGGNELEKIRIETKDLPFIKIIGFQSRKIVVNINRQSYLSICLLSGFSLLEACAGNNSIISYDIEWHRELIQDNKTGYLFKNGSIDSIVDQINYLLNNNEKNSEIGQNARSFMETKHSLTTTFLTKQKFYDNLFYEY